MRSIDKRRESSARPLFHPLFYCTLFSLTFAQNTATASTVTRSDAFPAEVENAPDAYFEGYIQALVDMHYAEYHVIVIAQSKKIWLSNLPKNELLAKSIVQFVKDVPGVREVIVLDHIPEETEELRVEYVERPRVEGIWFPQMTELFQPLVGSPRVISYTLGFRTGDHICGNFCADISLGDDFPIYRWLDVLWHGDLQLGIEGGIFSVFNLHPSPDIVVGAEGTELVNTDFYGAIPLSYAKNKWSARVRIFHWSGHLGDEYMINHPNVKRLNPSNEIIDFFVSYQYNEALRFYVGPAVIVHSDPTFPWKPLYIDYGTEIRFLGTKFLKQRVYGTLFMTFHFQNMQELDWNFDGTYRAGYEFSKLQGIGRKFRCYIEYHRGYSYEGQFSKKRDHYMQYNINYGF
ncbi:MAG: DUF1207 domain-containing protein [Verrucomicrobiota bacterium]|nr:DUF1207 domain-containing protein [Verrucomicrobiota bacterium]